MNLNTNIIINDTVFLQEVDEETILLDTSTQEYFSLNEVGGVFYNILQDEPNLIKAISILEEQFDVSIKQLENDMLIFVQALKEKGLIHVYDKVHEDQTN